MDRDNATDAMVTHGRTRRLVVKVTNKMRGDLYAMAEKEGRTPTDMVRRLIQVAAIERLGIGR